MKTLPEIKEAIDFIKLKNDLEDPDPNDMFSRQIINQYPEKLAIFNTKFYDLLENAIWIKKPNLNTSRHIHQNSMRKPKTDLTKSKIEKPKFEKSKTFKQSKPKLNEPPSKRLPHRKNPNERQPKQTTHISKNKKVTKPVTSATPSNDAESDVKIDHSNYKLASTTIKAELKLQDSSTQLPRVQPHSSTMPARKVRFMGNSTAGGSFKNK